MDKLAEEAGVHRNTVATLETGKLGDMTLDTLNRLASALGVTVDILDDGDHRPGRGVA